MDKIVSYGQSGGITAKTVNLHNGSRGSSGPLDFLSFLISHKRLVVILVLFFGGTYFFMPQDLRTQLGGFLMLDKDIHVNAKVVSFNQSGGITAESVIINPKSERHLDDSQKAQLISLLPKEKTQIVISVIGGDAEAYNYANEIASYLEANTWSVQRPFNVWLMTVEPLVGQQISPDGTQITIGKNPYN